MNNKRTILALSCLLLLTACSSGPSNAGKIDIENAISKLSESQIMEGSNIKYDSERLQKVRVTCQVKITESKAKELEKAFNRAIVDTEESVLYTLKVEEGKNVIQLSVDSMNVYSQTAMVKALASIVGEDEILANYVAYSPEYANLYIYLGNSKKNYLHVYTDKSQTVTLHIENFKDMWYQASKPQNSYPVEDDSEISVPSIDTSNPEDLFENVSGTDWREN